MNKTTLCIILAINASIQSSQASNALQGLTTPLHVKVYCTTKSAFSLTETERPLNFRPFDDALKPYSWMYIPKTRSEKEKCYILTGFTDKDKSDAEKAGLKLLLNPLASGGAPAPIPGQQPGQPQVAQAQPQAQPGQPQPPQGTGQVQKPPTPGAPGTPGTPTPPTAPIAGAPSAQGTAANVPSKSSAAPSQPGQAAPTVAQTTPPPQQPQPATQAAPQKDPQLVLELKVVCTNSPDLALTPDGAKKILPDGAQYGDTFDLLRNKRCNFYAKKYKQDIPQPEMKEIVEQIFYGIKGPEGIFK